MLLKPITQTQKTLNHKTPLIFLALRRQHSWRRQDDESRQVKVSVWWDFENCNLSNGVNVLKVSSNITAALRANGIKGPVSVTAFGNVMQLSRANQEALSCTGVNLTHVPHGGKNSADRSLLVELMYWISQNPPPAHVFLISGDRDFASTLHRLRMNNYNILLASSENYSGVLCSAASIMWQWQALLKGENFVGKHFNQPPDGPYNSWYGHSKIPLENPFSTTEQAALRNNELSDTSSDAKLRPVPNDVRKQLIKIVSSHPNGISLNDLRRELYNSNVLVDKDYYGHKRFSCFLFSMPHIFAMKYENNGNFTVRALPAKNHESTTSKYPMPGKSNITSESLEPTESSSDVALGSFKENGNGDRASTAKLDSQHQSRTVDMDAKQAPPSLPGTKGRDTLKKTSECQKEGHDFPFSSTIKAEGAVAEFPGSNQLPADKRDKREKEETENTASEIGFLRRFWLKWFNNDDCNSMRRRLGDVNDLNVSAKSSCKDPRDTLEKHNAVGDSPSKTKAEKKCIEPVHDSARPRCSPVAASTDKLLQENNADANVGLFGKITKMFQFWRSDPDPNKLSDSSTKHDIFSEESFWSDIETFLDTPQGSALVIRSETRGQMAENLRKEGPPVLRFFNTDDYNHLVDLLISEKKWVEECPTHTPSFKLTLPAVKSSSEQPHQSNGLSSLFSEKSSQPDMQKVPDHDGLKDIRLKKVCLKQSRSEVVADCHRLVKQLLKEHPEGYNIAFFRKLFLERYNYPLDLQKLGYQKLQSLLQIMPGVRVESSYIIPSGKVSKKVLRREPLPDIKQKNLSPSVSDSDDNSSDALKKNVNADSAWEELGPVSKGSQGMELESLPNKKVIAVTERQTRHVYEPSLSVDDGFSDTEPETSAESVSDREGKSRLNEDDSSLLQILDTWYSSKEGANTRKLKTETLDGLREVVQATESYGERDFKSDTSLKNNDEKFEDNAKLETEMVDGTIDYSNDGLEINGQNESGNRRRLKTEKVDDILYSSRDDLETPNCTEVDVKSETTLRNSPKKRKPLKKEYLFVSDPVDEKKDKLMDGILGSFKKSGESGIHS